MRRILLEVPVLSGARLASQAICVLGARFRFPSFLNYSGFAQLRPFGFNVAIMFFPGFECPYRISSETFLSSRLSRFLRRIRHL